jgi:hypothetical protein
VKKILALIAVLNFYFISMAQLSKRQAAFIKNTAVCGGMDSILARKGKWTKVEDADVFADKTLPRAEWKLVRARQDSICKFFKEAITDLSGFEAEWYRGARGGSYTANGPVPYSFQSLYKTYYCNNNLNKIILGDETANWHHVFVNHYNWFAKKIGDWDYKGDGKKIMIFLLPPKVGTWKGRTLYAPLIHSPNARAVVIGHNNKLPWRSLTRKEYLVGLKSWLQEMKDKWGDGGKTKEMNFIDDYIASNDTATLNKPAVVFPRGGLGFNGKWEDEENGGSRVIVFSAAYWNKDLPRYVPQFMILYWHWDDDPVSLSSKNQFEENFPLEKLKSLIDK